jgi:hypothetical protein
MDSTKGYFTIQIYGEEEFVSCPWFAFGGAHTKTLRVKTALSFQSWLGAFFGRFYLAGFSIKLHICCFPCRIFCNHHDQNPHPAISRRI